MTLKITGSGRKADDIRSVTITLIGSDMDLIHLVDELSLVEGPDVTQLCRTINWYGGNAVDLPAPDSR
jgi:hypothetical protein